MPIDLFRCRYEYVETLMSRADDTLRPLLKDLYIAKLADHDGMLVDAVDALFRELVLVGGGE